MNDDPGRITLPGGRRNLAKSATRALDVLELLAELRRPLRATEIAKAFGWHGSSTDQLLKTLVDSGYLIFDAPRKHYRPSPRLVNFAAWLTADYYSGDRLRRLLALVHARSGETVTLAVRQGELMQVVDVVQPEAGAAVSAKGLSVPVIGSALGSAYLAGRPDTELRQIIAWIDRHRRGPERLDEVLAVVSQVRARGYSSGGIGSDGKTDGQPASWPIAMALPPCDAGVGLVLGYSGQIDKTRDHEAEFAALMRRCIAEVLTP